MNLLIPQPDRPSFTAATVGAGAGAGAGAGGQQGQQQPQQPTGPNTQPLDMFNPQASLAAYLLLHTRKLQHSASDSAASGPAQTGPFSLSWMAHQTSVLFVPASSLCCTCAPLMHRSELDAKFQVLGGSHPARPGKQASLAESCILWIKALFHLPQLYRLPICLCMLGLGQRSR